MPGHESCCQCEAAKWVLTAENPSANIVFFEPIRPGLSTFAAIHRISNESDYEVLVETQASVKLKLNPHNSIDVSSATITLAVAKVRENDRACGTYKLLCCALAGEKELEVNTILRVVGDLGQPVTVKVLP
jgi:hypothetical protein